MTAPGLAKQSMSPTEQQTKLPPGGLAIEPTALGSTDIAASDANNAGLTPIAEAVVDGQRLSSPRFSIAETSQAVSDATEPSLEKTDANDAKQALAASLADIILNILSTRKFAVRALV